MTVWLRPSMGLSDEADLVIHMGTGDATSFCAVP